MLMSEEETIVALKHDMREMERLAWLCNICKNKEGCQNPNGCIGDFRWRGPCSENTSAIEK